MGEVFLGPYNESQPRMFRFNNAKFAGSYLEIGVSTARTQQTGPSRGQAAWEYLLKFLLGLLKLQGRLCQNFGRKSRFLSKWADIEKMLEQRRGPLRFPGTLGQVLSILEF
ncbi:hypothetical protein Prudu_010042 [Prunus dulcis]|uniref:Uncharacterized protein n=1 Tax=Prunus dulcis TaxID=3755 RepID=A0A4Y1R7R7_PRUDU|nr:hypothetical protein Prudu_010042 [Prunus dulcis]